MRKIYILTELRPLALFDVTVSKTEKVKTAKKLKKTIGAYFLMLW